MALAALLAAVVVLSIAGQAQHAPWQVTVLSPESYPLAGGTQQILDLAASVLLPGYAFAQSVTLDPTPTGSITDAGALELLSPRGIATFTSDGRTYAAVASFGGSFVGGGVQILDITDPRNIAAAGHIPDSSYTELSGAWGIATFTSDGRTYAAVTSQRGGAVQILDVTDPYSVTAAGSITDSSGDLVLESPRGIAVFVSGNSTYAAVAASGDDNGVQILDVTDPYSVAAAGSIADTDALELKSPRGIAIFESGNSTYAAVAASGGDDDGVQILNITDPYSVTAAGSIANIRDLELDGARSIAIFESGNSTYAAVAATFDNAVQILNITDPYSVAAAGSVTNTDDLELERPRGIATFTSGGSAYAAVAASDSDVVQILDVTDPHSVTAAGSVTNTDGLKLDGHRPSPYSSPAAAPTRRSPHATTTASRSYTWPATTHRRSTPGRTRRYPRGNPSACHGPQAMKTAIPSCTCGHRTPPTPQSPSSARTRPPPRSRRRRWTLRPSSRSP